jgi:hypothetical protein
VSQPPANHQATPRPSKPSLASVLVGEVPKLPLTADRRVKQLDELLQQLSAGGGSHTAGDSAWAALNKPRTTAGISNGGRPLHGSSESSGRRLRLLGASAGVGAESLGEAYGDGMSLLASLLDISMLRYQVRKQLGRGDGMRGPVVRLVSSATARTLCCVCVCVRVCWGLLVLGQRREMHRRKVMWVVSSEVCPCENELLRPVFASTVC